MCSLHYVQIYTGHSIQTIDPLATDFFQKLLNCLDWDKYEGINRTGSSESPSICKRVYITYCASKNVDPFYIVAF